MNMLAIMLATTVNFTTQTACHPEDFKHYDTATMRGRFVMEKVMVPDEIHVTYTMYDRLVYGGVMPVTKELTLETFDELKAEHFLDRRELGVINVGGTGTVTVDGEKYELEFKEALYVGCGKKEVKFASADTTRTARSRATRSATTSRPARWRSRTTASSTSSSSTPSSRRSPAAA